MLFGSLGPAAGPQRQLSVRRAPPFAVAQLVLQLGPLLLSALLGVLQPAAGAPGALSGRRWLEKGSAGLAEALLRLFELYISVFF